MTITMRCMGAVLTTVAVLALTTSASAIPEGPADGTPEWTQREATNYGRTAEAPTEQAQNPSFQLRWNLQSNANHQDWVNRALADPSWIGPPSGNSEVTPLAATWGTVATGDPTRYAAASGPNGQAFYANEADIIPVVYYDDGCARISGRVWAPHGWTPGDTTLPGVVIENGSVEAPETLYWWFAQQLVRAGYVAMTFDPRGQGRSDLQTPTGGQGSNVDSTVFYTGMVDAVDFFRSSPTQPYAHNVTCAGSYPTVVTASNPFFDRIDPTRLGIAGHSLGAAGVSAVQGYPGSRFQIPNPDGSNPVDVVLAWDGLGLDPDGPPRVPAMGQSSEYGLTPHPFTSSPDPESKKTAYDAYRDAGIPVFVFTIQGSSHYEWSLIPTFPTTSWCPDMSTGSCLGGWGHPMAEHYSLAWMDRWLKLPGEVGYADADARLLADADWCPRYSFYLRSARAFSSRDDVPHHSEDIRAECLGQPVTTPTATIAAPTETAATPTPTSTPTPLCPPAAASGCKKPTVSGKGSLQMRDRTPDSSDRFGWKWIKGEATTTADLGSPTTSTSYALCVYDGTGGLVTSANAPADGVCDGKPCWKATGSGFKYRKRDLSGSGTVNTFQIIVKPGASGKAKLIVTGKAGVPAIPRLPIALPVTAQLVNGDGTCWQATFSSPRSTNQPDRFKSTPD